MKKVFTTFLSLLIVGAIANGQGNSIKQKSAQEFLNSKNSTITTIPYSVSVVNSKMTTTCIDTILYPQSKTTGLEVDTMYFGYVEGVAEAYYLTSNGFVHGVRAYILLDTNSTSGDVSSLNMLMKISNIDALKRPTTLIDSAFITVNDIGQQEQTFMFTNPVPVSGDFTVSIELDPAIPLRGAWYVTNSSVNADGNDEQLAATLYAGIWYNFQGQFTPPWDIDHLVAPIFETDVTASFTEDTLNLCLGQSVTFTNTSSLNMDSMFNQMTGPAYTWNYDDGTGTYNHTDTTYTYGSPGVYRPTLYANYYGYTVTCTDSITYTTVPNVYILVADTIAIANFGWTDMGGGTYQLSDSSIVSGSGSYSWTFQGGTPSTSSLSNPTVTFATPGNYEVCLTVMDSTGCAMDMFCDSISFTVGIDDFYAADYVKVYPIPANKHFNVSVPSNYFGGKIILTDIVGKTLKSIDIGVQETIEISTSEIASGIYFVSIDYENERVFTRRIIIDK
ncbi:MAG: hypothetical protein COA97_07045 [Flavobacteriales bacterium]|nr:MAG: hypothetical protein COA97_07045 [Flavobacteriales bacterium]